jgi:SulP family sulfate permease
MTRWVPRSIQCLREYDRTKFLHDLIAGVTVGLVALPLAMAFAISSGLPPQTGLYTAVVAGFLISALGGSTAQVGGPTGAFVVIIYNIVQRYGVDGLLVCTMMAGVLLFVLGATGLGTAVRFIPRPVVLGFTNGIAVLIASTQIKDFFGLKVDKVPGDFLGRMEALVHALPTIHPVETTLACLSLAVVLFCLRFAKHVPGAIAAMVFGTTLAFLMHLPVETIATRFHGIPEGLPQAHMPVVSLSLMITLISPAVTVAMLGAIESLMSAVVSDRMTGDKHNPNTELMAQGVANFVVPFFGGFAATGAIARTATNIRAGARTPVAGMIHALVLLGVLVVAAPLAGHIPLAVLAAILMMVAYHMGEWHEIPKLLRLSAADRWVWALTFLLTVFADLTVAVEFGMIVAALVFIRKVTATTTVAEATEDYIEAGRVHTLQDKDIPNYAVVFRIHGPFLFGSTEKLQELEHILPTLPPVILLRLRNMTALDTTGLHALEQFADKVHRSGRALILCGAPRQPAELMKEAEFEKHVGRANICNNVVEALIRAREVFPQVKDTCPNQDWDRRRRKRDSEAVPAGAGSG